MRYNYKVGDELFVVDDTPTRKTVRSTHFNSFFDKQTGSFMRWGRTVADDPQFSPIGPEILDIEISVDGCPNACGFCYKSNTPKPATNMSFETFRSIIDMMPKTLTQVAFGITGIQTNPDFIRMMEYCREIGVIPNFTLTGIDLTDELAKQCSKLVGAVAVSAYSTDKNVCYDTVSKFISLGITQTNIHLMVSEENENFVQEVLRDRISDSRLRQLNAIVFLGVKPKGRAVSGYSSLPIEGYRELVRFCLDNKIVFGFDSCSAPKFELVIRDDPKLPSEQKKRLLQSVESCESDAFSGYINVHGEWWHCSFTEHEKGFAPIRVLDAHDFLKDIWNAPEVNDFRKRLLDSSVDGCRRCIVFPSINPIGATK